MTHTTEHPPRAARKLAVFIGQWKVEGRLRNGNTQAVVSGIWSFEPAIDGWGVRGILSTEIEGMGAMDESELIGFDAAQGKVHMFSANRFAIRDHVGEWTADDQLEVRYQATVDGSEITEDITLNFNEPGRIEADVVERADGAVVLTTDLTLTKLVA
jgi:hypothetical protein